MHIEPCRWYGGLQTKSQWSPEQTAVPPGGVGHGVVSMPLVGAHPPNPSHTVADFKTGGEPKQDCAPHAVDELG
jgi:hypothetical protein